MDMNWLTVADFLRTKRCHEAKRTGVCGCRAKPKNACGVATEMAEACEELDSGRNGSRTPEDIAKLVRWKACGTSRRGGECQHRVCMKAEELAAWIRSSAA